MKNTSLRESDSGLTWYSVDGSQWPEHSDGADGRQAGVMAIQRILHHPGDAVGEKVGQRAETNWWKTHSFEAKLEEVVKCRWLTKERLELHSLKQCISNSLSDAASLTIYCGN